jgi:hypothetical protein
VNGGAGSGAGAGSTVSGRAFGVTGGAGAARGARREHVGPARGQCALRHPVGADLRARRHCRRRRGFRFVLLRMIPAAADCGGDEE